MITSDPPTLPPPHLPAALAYDHFCSILGAEGLRSALAYLACLGDCPCVGVYRIEAGRAHVLAHVDRHHPHEPVERVPEAVIGSCHVRDARGVLTTVDALRGQAGRAASSCRGLPILDPEGVLLGTLCHHDPRARSCEPPDLMLLLQVTSALARSGLLPPPLGGLPTTSGGSAMRWATALR